MEAGSTPAGIAIGFKVVVNSLKTIPNVTERATVGNPRQDQSASVSEAWLRLETRESIHFLLKCRVRK